MIKKVLIPIPLFKAIGTYPPTLIHITVGNFLNNDLVPARKLEDAVPSLETSDREAFLSFIKQMLTWLPEERKTARELMEHPFLND